MDYGCQLWGLGFSPKIQGVGQEEVSLGCTREGLEKKFLHQKCKALEEAAKGSH